MTSVQVGHGDLDPGWNDAGISPRPCLPEVTSDLQNINHQPLAHHVGQEKYPGHSLTQGEAASPAAKQKELILALTGRSFLFSVSERDPRDYFAGSTSCILQLICLNNSKLVQMCKANESLYVISLDRQGCKRLHPL